jgi:hypothetical protein
VLSPLSTAPHRKWDVLTQYFPGSVPPPAVVGAHQGRRVARFHAGADVLLGGGAVRLLGAVCAPQVISAAGPRGAVGVLREGGAEILRSAVGDVAAALVAIAATLASARAVGYVAPQVAAPNVASFSERAAALQEANRAGPWTASQASRAQQVTISRLCHAPWYPEPQSEKPSPPITLGPEAREPAIVR